MTTIETRNTALPDENQERVLASVVVGTGDPNQKAGRTEMIGKRGDTGAIKKDTFSPLAVGPQYENVPVSEQYLSDNTSGKPTGYVGQ